MNKKTSELFSNTNLKLSPVAYYYKDFDGGFFMNHHYHNYIEFMYCVSGSFSISIYNPQNKSFKVVKVNKNQMIYTNPDLIHKLILSKDEKASILNVEFAMIFNYDRVFEKSINTAQFFTTYLKELYDNNDDYRIINDQYIIKKTLTDLVTYLGEHKEKDYLDQSVRVLAFFYSIKKALEKSKEGEYAFIRSAIAYMNENLDKELSVESISKYVNKSPSYFAHMFKADRGASVLKYINNLRIDKARYLLMNSSLSIAEIATAVGFKNKDQLNYQFHALINSTPSEYKKTSMHKEIDSPNKGYISTGLPELGKVRNQN